MPELGPGTVRKILALRAIAADQPGTEEGTTAAAIAARLMARYELTEEGLHAHAAATARAKAIEAARALLKAIHGLLEALGYVRVPNRRLAELDPQYSGTLDYWLWGAPRQDFAGRWFVVANGPSSHGEVYNRRRTRKPWRCFCCATNREAGTFAYGEKRSTSNDRMYRLCEPCVDLAVADRVIEVEARIGHRLPDLGDG